MRFIHFLALSIYILLIIIIFLSGEKRSRKKFQSTDHIHVPEENIYALQPDEVIRVLAAYQFEDHIAVTTFSIHEPETVVRCYYYTNTHQLIPDSSQPSIFSGYSYVKCPIVETAKFINIISTELGKSPDPVPIKNQDKTFNRRRKAVCVGPIYGSDIHWENIVKFIEHHNLAGFNYYYLTVFNISAYDQQIIDDYVRLGMVDVTHVAAKREMHQVEYELIQKQNCVFKQKGNVKRSIHIKYPEERSEKHVNFYSDQIWVDFYDKQETKEKFNAMELTRANSSKILGNRRGKLYWENESLSGYVSPDQNHDGKPWEVTHEDRYVRAVDERIRYIYDKRKLYCDEINMLFFSMCDEQIYHCEHRTYESEKHVQHLKLMYRRLTTPVYNVPNW